MTAATDIQPTTRDVPSDDVIRSGSPRIWRRLFAGFVVGFVLTVLVAGGALLAWDMSYDARVLPGVRVGTTNLSGMDRAQATAALEEAYRSYGEGRVLIHTIAGDVGIDYAEFDRRLAVDGLVDAALVAGRSGGPAERAIGEIRQAIDGVELAPAVTFDHDALRSSIAAALRPLEVRPIDAQIGNGPNGVRVLHGRPGRTFDPGAAFAVAVASLGSPDAPPEIPVTATAIEVKPDRDDADVLAAQDAANRLVSSVVVKGAGGRWKIPAAKVEGWISFDVAADGSTRPVIDEAAIRKSLIKARNDIAREPISAEYLRSKSGSIVGVKAGRDGRTLDRRATATAIVAELERRAAGQPSKEVKVVITHEEPKLTTAAATKKAPLMTRLGSWQTYFPISERNYFGANIWLPAQIINGTVLKPGQRFEWWSGLGPVTTSRGFGLGGYIAGDHTDPTGAMGGGMCSASTTLFNAALRAGLAIGARDNHRYYIDRYPLGLDATVSSAQTMSFTNDMKTPILIRGFKVKSGSSGWVRFEIWGIADGRSVALSKPAVSNVRKATTKTVYVDTLKPGEREQTEYPANGMNVTVTRTVRTSSGGLLHQDRFSSPYQLWNGRIEVGR